MVCLDNAATTQPKFFAKDFAGQWMNTNMSYSKIENIYLEEARNRIKACLGVKSGKVITGATASHMMEILMNWRGIAEDGIVIGSAHEHDAIERYIDIHVTSLAELSASLERFGGLKYVIWMHVNNMTGKIFNVESIGKLCKQYGAYFICDMTASIGKTPIPPNLDKWCSCCFASAHKWHGEKNQGFMWLSDDFAKHLGLNDQPKDEYGLKWGTTDTPSILAMTDALEYTTSHLEANLEHYRELHDYMYHYADSKGLYLYEKVKDSCDAISAVTIPFCDSDALCNYLWSKGIYMGGNGSACSEDRDWRVLKSFDYTDEECANTVRISFSEDNTFENIDALINAIVDFKNKF